VIEAAVAASPLLPSVKADRDFLCGMEFDSLSAELAFFRRHGLDVEEVTIDVALRPGQLMVFDNLALAHGRRGCRQSGRATSTGVRSSTTQSG
jgi:alpha-ketoglutarate-dependent taurine dioxygenase